MGRITRQDVADVLVSILDEGNAAAAVGKTVEVLALAGAVFYSVMTVVFVNSISLSLLMCLSLFLSLSPIL